MVNNTYDYLCPAELEFYDDNLYISPFSDTQQQSSGLDASGEVILHDALNIT